MRTILKGPPYTPREPVTEILHGVEVTDPYRWLEDSTSPRTRNWLAEQTEHTRSFLDSLPSRARIRTRVAELLSVEANDAPCKVGSRYFFLKRTAQLEQPIICMRTAENGPDEVLIDPTTWPEDNQTSVRIVSVSPDARLLAYGIKRDGRDYSEIRLFDVEGRRDLNDGLPRGYLSGLVFASDSKSYYYVHEALDAVRPNYRAARRHVIGSNPDEDSEVFVAGDDPQLKLGLRGSDEGRYLAYLVVQSHEHVTITLLLKDLVSDAPPRVIAENMEGVFYPFIVGRQLIVLTKWQAPNKRIIAIDVDSHEREMWREVVPESELSIRDFAVRQQKIFVSYVNVSGARTDVYDLHGTRTGTLPYPSGGTVRLLPNPGDGDELFYTFTSFVQPETIFRYCIQSGKQKVWSQRNVAFDPSSIVIKQVRCTSRDGTRVPMFLLSKQGLQQSRNTPAVLTGYGGFGKSSTPQFSAFATFLIERDCIFAVANVRGGSELGEQWHRDGKREKRQNAFDDFIAAAEWLIDAGYTQPGKLAIAGASNGGLLAGVAFTQRPDLFRAAICIGPLLDMLRYHHARFSDLWVDEYGSADNPRDFAHLYAYSPYQRVRDGVVYPSVLLISGDADTRCDPMHARKMVARLQVVSDPARPALLHYSPFRGHVATLPLHERIEALTDRLAFLCDQLNVPV